MADLINRIAEWIEAIVLAIGYPGVFLVMLIENVFPPVPTDPLLPFVGILVADGKMNYFLAWLMAVSGALVGSLMLYAVGAWANEPIVRGVIRRYGQYIGVQETALDRVLAGFNKYGAGMIFFGRAIPVLRSAISITAGVSRMNLPKFLFFSGLNSLLVTGFWLTVGVALGENWRVVLDWIERFELPIIIILVIGGGIWAIRWWVKRRRMAGVEGETPHITR
ncbi:MAG: DedA family protein [Chloroflexi bacterium]|nr:MAG: DedA family protein [Chloroflexota bacterium]